MRISFFPVASTFVTRGAKASAVTTMSDIVRVPINTADGPAFILLGTSGDTGFESNHTNPEGIIIVKQAVDGLQVEFIASEIIPDDMKNGLRDRIETLGTQRSVHNPGEQVSQQVRESVSSGMTDSVMISQETDESKWDIAPALGHDDAQMSSSPSPMDEYETSAQDLDFTDARPAISYRGGVSSTSTTSTVSPPSHVKNSSRNQSGRLNGQDDRSSSTKNSNGLSSECVVTISVGVFVLIFVGII